MLGRLVIAALCLSSTALSTGPLMAQGDAIPRPIGPTGFRVGLSGWIGQPNLGGDARKYLEQYGGFGWRPGGALEVGLDFRQFALSATFDIGRTYFVEHQASDIAAISLIAEWAPSRLAFGDWQPLFSIGAIHEEIDMGGIDTGNRNFDFPLISGNGARVGIALERMLGDKTAILGRTSIDVLSVTQQSRFTTYSIDRDGWSVFPRIAVGLRWWPFSHRTR